MNVRQLARAEIQALRPYEAAAQVEDTIRLNANEAPWQSAGDDFRRPLNRYPEIRPQRLRVQLAARYGVDAANLLVTRGSSEAIDLLIRVFCRPGIDNLVTTSPSFSMYGHYAAIQGATFRQVETDRNAGFAVDAARVLDACDDTTRLVFLCSPNNPTGNLLPRETVTAILSARNGRSVLVVDEAYIEFADVPSASELVSTHDNLVVLRTLSKAHAFAGVRCGAVIASDAVIDMLDAVQAPYALATPVVECVEDTLCADSLDQAAWHVAETVRERQRVSLALAACPAVLRVWPSDANFLLVQVRDADKLMQQTASDRVLLRYFGGSLRDCVRISIGSSEENDRMLESLSRLEYNNG